MCQNALLSTACRAPLPAREKSPQLKFAAVAVASFFLVLSIAGTAFAAGEVSSSVEGEALIAKAPQDPQSYLTASAFASSQGDQAAALAILEKGRLKANSSSALLVALADLYWEMELREEALATLHEAVQLDDDSVDARYRLVYVTAATGEARAAEMMCRKYMTRWPESPQLLVALGEALEEQDKQREAFVCYGRAIGIDDRMAAAYSRRGRLYCLFRQYDAAEVACRQALDLDPYDPIAHAYLGIACAERGKVLEANAHAAVAEEAGMQMDVVWAKLNW